MTPEESHQQTREAEIAFLKDFHAGKVEEMPRFPTLADGRPIPKQDPALQDREQGIIDQLGNY